MVGGSEDERHLYANYARKVEARFRKHRKREYAELDVKVTGISTQDYGSPAPRPRFGTLDNRLWRSEGRTPLRSFQDALSHFLAQSINKVSA